MCVRVKGKNEFSEPSISCDQKSEGSKKKYISRLVSRSLDLILIPQIHRSPGDGKIRFRRPGTDVPGPAATDQSNQSANPGSPERKYAATQHHQHD